MPYQHKTIREEVKQSIKECKGAGIKVIMITGDHPLTALSIARQLRICIAKEEVTTGEEIQKYKAKVMKNSMTL